MIGLMVLWNGTGERQFGHSTIWVPDGVSWIIWPTIRNNSFVKFRQGVYRAIVTVAFWGAFCNTVSERSDLEECFRPNRLDEIARSIWRAIMPDEGSASYP
jgi:hypothetical protein